MTGLSTRLVMCCAGVCVVCMYVFVHMVVDLQDAEYVVLSEQAGCGATRMYSTAVHVW